METLARKLGVTAVALVFCCGAVSSRADIVYDNTVNDLQLRFGAQNGVQIGDQITLDGTFRRVTSFTCEYFGTNFSGDETATIRFYQNDGPLFNGYSSPLTPLFTSTPIPITSTIRSTVGWAFSTENLDVPDNFTWTIEFNGIDGPGEGAGLDLYAPVNLGSSFGDYWQLNGASWALLQNTNGIPINFAAQLQATVPEPSSMALLALGGIVGAFVWNRRRLG